MARRERSQGAFELSRLALTQEQIAAKLGRKQEQVSRWVNGQLRPSKATRAAMFVAFGIRPEAWDELAKGSPLQEAPQAPAAPDEALDDKSVRARAERLQRMLDAQLGQLERDTQATPLERAKVMSSVAATLKVLGAITGEAQEIGESRILRLPAWRRIEDALIEALRPWPEAARAAAETLREMGESA